MCTPLVSRKIFTSPTIDRDDIMAGAGETVLRLSDLSGGMPALTAAQGKMHSEAASVCLAKCGHAMQTHLLIRDVNNATIRLCRDEVDDTIRLAYADMPKTTELGAIGIAILLIRRQFSMTVIEQSRKGTGFDYWLGAPGETGLPFQNKARLEVSGILKGDESQFRARVKQKQRQPAPSDGTGLPAYAVVVEFGTPQAEVAQR
jgi:hypothetical protein